MVNKTGIYGHNKLTDKRNIPAHKMNNVLLQNITTLCTRKKIYKKKYWDNRLLEFPE